MGARSRGTKLLGGRYRLVERLGLGGMSVVWRGYDEVLGRQVAVKVLSPTLATDEVFRRRIRTEAQAAARLCHPHITNVYDYGEARRADGTTVPYVVMELVEGEPMSARLRDGAAMPWRLAVTACAEVASALAVAHARGVVHRDVTPNNVMLTAVGAKVLDFGISALVGESDIGPDGALLGTPAYLAPERMDAGVVSAATDVYALGLMLYRAVTGGLPWQAATTTQMLKAHRYAEPEPMPPIPGLPAEVRRLCRQCLAKQPEDRPGSARVARTLAAAVGVPVFLPTPARARAVSAAWRLPGPAVAQPAASFGLAVSGEAGQDDLDSMSTTILSWKTPPRAPRGRRRPAIDEMADGSQRVSVARAGVAGLAGLARRVLRHSTPDTPNRRRLTALAATSAMVAVGTVTWAGSTSTVDGSQGSGNPLSQPLALGLQAGQAGCRVDFTLDADTGSEFAADVTLSNTGTESVRGWQLTFAFPGDQRIERGTGAVWRQDGRTVVVRPSDPADLAPGEPVELSVVGTYRSANPLPVVFALNDSACAAMVSGTSGGGTARTSHRRPGTRGDGSASDGSGAEASSADGHDPADGQGADDAGGRGGKDRAGTGSRRSPDSGDDSDNDRNQRRAPERSTGERTERPADDDPTDGPVGMPVRNGAQSEPITTTDRPTAGGPGRESAIPGPAAGLRATVDKKLDTGPARTPAATTSPTGRDAASSPAPGTSTSSSGTTDGEDARRTKSPQAASPQAASPQATRSQATRSQATPPPPRPGSPEPSPSRTGPPRSGSSSTPVPPNN